MKKEDEIPIGTRVMLNPTSQYADDSPYNPTGIKGIIIEHENNDDDNTYRVRWDNGKENNCYKIGEDLIILNTILNHEFYY